MIQSSLNTLTAPANHALHFAVRTPLQLAAISPGAAADGQDVLTVPDMRSKILCQCAGFGVGYLPVNLVREEIEARQLVVKEVLEPKPGAQLFIADARSIAARR